MDAGGPPSSRYCLRIQLLALLPIAAFAALAYAGTTKFREYGSIHPIYFRTYLLETMIWVVLGVILTVLLLAQLSPDNPFKRSRIPSEAIAASSTWNVLLAIAGLELWQVYSSRSYNRLLDAVTETILLTSVAFGLLITGITAVKFNDLSGRAVKAARVMAAVNGLVSLGFTTLFVFSTLFPPQGA